MTKIIYDADTIKMMSLFESLTHARLKDFFDDPIQERLVFIVQSGQLWKALGKSSANIPKLQKAYNRKIKIVEFSDDLCTFIKNIAQPLHVTNVSESDGIVTIKDDDMKTKGLLIGKNARNLRNMEKNVQRYFKVEEIKVE